MFGRRGGAPPVIEAPKTAYREAVVAGAGRLRGVVKLSGERPRDSTVTPTSHQDVCGRTLVQPTVEGMADRLEGAVVWLADVRTGKRVPLARRFELLNVRCQLTPRVQGVLVGGTLNVRSDDAAPHHNRLVRQRTGETIVRVSETDEGTVVPVDRALTEVGVIEVRCDDHPWTHAWIAVFDHPYYAVTGADGRFAMDSVPPGTYRLVTWHPRLGRTEQSVTVGGGPEEMVEVTLKAE